MQEEVQRAERVVAAVRSWVYSEAMQRLRALIAEQSSHATSTGGNGDSSWLHLNERLPQWLVASLDGAGGEDTHAGWVGPSISLLRDVIDIEKQAADDFDFRGRDGEGYRERSEAATAQFDADTRNAVLELTTQLGLVEPAEPKYDAYDKTLILGGGYRSPLLRTRYAASLQQRGVELGELYFLGSPRFLITKDPAEKPVTSTYAPNATDEFGLLQGAAEAEFGFSAGRTRFLCGCVDASSICPRWRHVDDDRAAEVPPEYTHERSADVTSSGGRHRGSVISASTSRPPYRPDTSDTYELLLRFADPRVGQRILTITTQVFVPFQRFDGLRRLYLPRGLELDAVGYGADWGDRPQTAEYLLQETLSAIRSARRLLVDAVEVLLAATAGAGTSTTG